ncbi:hypothetical protein Patl1_13402 [Pistacia atlantica]|uniref:Uncharacterized protein n=1 Tax=Pistacia atlantica TaxID=434234 RepID=A0ACC1ASX9_9ROSI|nr:hypothetical protein Patl1_13402 [Pistacia atlantica]
MNKRSSGFLPQDRLNFLVWTGSFQAALPLPLLEQYSLASSGIVPMSKKRGLSLEEKRGKILEIFYESQNFFLLKELEKSGPKKGVITQSVKDVVQSLVDDDLVSKDKIGTSVYFWSLPSCAGNQDERKEAVEELKDIELKYNELKDEMGQYADNDPAAFEAMKNATEVAHAAANRWTDNIFTLRQWCSNNFPQAKEQLEHLYREVGITDDFDYLETSPVVPLSSVDKLEGTP